LWCLSAEVRKFQAIEIWSGKHILSQATILSSRRSIGTSRERLEDWFSKEGHYCLINLFSS